MRPRKICQRAPRRGIREAKLVIPSVETATRQHSGQPAQNEYCFIAKAQEFERYRLIHRLLT